MKLPFTWADTAKCEPDIQCTDRDYKKEKGKRGRGQRAGQYAYQISFQASFLHVQENSYSHVMFTKRDCIVSFEECLGNSKPLINIC